MKNCAILFLLSFILLHSTESFALPVVNKESISAAVIGAQFGYAICHVDEFNRPTNEASIAAIETTEVDEGGVP